MLGQRLARPRRKTAPEKDLRPSLRVWMSIHGGPDSAAALLI
jgi:hypothetical protein